MAIDRRDFLKAATAGAAGVSLGAVPPLSGGSLFAGAVPEPRATPLRRRAGQAPDVVVIGAGNFGIWTALNLQRLGVSVTVLDAYGPGNSRSTSGGETRGVRSSYGGRPEGFVWNRWANEAIRRWIQWDEEGQELLLPRVFYQSGDLILREEMAPYLEDTMAQWDRLGVDYELLDVDEIHYRWPWIRTEEGVSLGLHEPNAGVVRARRAIESVAKRFEMEGGEIRIARAALGGSDGRRLNDVTLGGDESLSGSTFVFAVGPWIGKTFPELIGDRVRIPVGNVFYFAVPDQRFMFPNMPSYGVPGCTGWPALGPDHRGFRVRVGGQQGDDPDTSDRWVPPEAHERPREILERYFPDMVGAAVNETRACHYCFGPSRNFLIDKHPDFDNVWLAGLGTAESFKQGPVLGEYIAKRVLELEDDPELAEQFRFSMEATEGGQRERRMDPEAEDLGG
ncbi:FAD-dependent oxidoreductase [Candidatus Palauibacter sp.]|uniref:FAD-dependent oxidoreductase n=1 Tax=Candidatus Palauibacter sp. TaxID=3101350 RepID=UPI003B5B11A8